MSCCHGRAVRWRNQTERRGRHRFRRRRSCEINPRKRLHPYPGLVLLLLVGAAFCWVQTKLHVCQMICFVNAKRLRRCRRIHLKAPVCVCVCLARFEGEISCCSVTHWVTHTHIHVKVTEEHWNKHSMSPPCVPQSCRTTWILLHWFSSIFTQSNRFPVPSLAPRHICVCFHFHHSNFYTDASCLSKC